MSFQWNYYCSKQEQDVEILLREPGSHIELMLCDSCVCQKIDLSTETVDDLIKALTAMRKEMK